MARYFLGVDSGTQSTKVVIVNADDGLVGTCHPEQNEGSRHESSGDFSRLKPLGMTELAGAVLASATSTYDLISGLPPGHKEQDPAVWIDAVEKCIVRAIKDAGIDAGEIAGIGVSGQQHGFVALDDKDQVIRPAKLWCDTATSKQCEELVAKLGGQAATIDLLGGRIAVGFTASKILWLKENEPDNYKRLRTVLLPHDYINFWLTGNKCMEYGDASGTGLFDIRERKWCRKVIDTIDSNLHQCLPSLVKAGEVIGEVRPDLCKRWGMSEDVIVSVGGGDNMMSAIGTGNVREGIVAASFGTSGTIYASANRSIVDDQGLVEGFCDSTGKWLPLVCTMNVTVATEMVRARFDLNHEEFSDLVSTVKPGSDGLILIPFFEGERTPNLPDATGVFFGIRPQTFDAAHMARASVEGVTLGMNYGLNQLRRLGIKPEEIRVTGGGAKSRVWREIMADIFNVEVVCLTSSEGAAFGAALQALWTSERTAGSKVTIEEISERFVHVDENTRVKPNPKGVEVYVELQELQNQLVNSMREDFRSHRQFLSHLSSLDSKPVKQLV
jgi:xylulokinase